MPTLAELRSRFLSPKVETTPMTERLEEALIVDVRGELRPAQMVELKLRSALHGGTLVRAGLVTPDGKRRASK